MVRLWRRKLAGFDPEVFQAVKLGDEARNRRDWASAARHYGDALSRNPQLTHIQIQRGHAYKELGDYDGASLAYLTALKDLQHDDDLHLQIGHLEKLRNNLYQAMSYYQRASDLNPSNYNARSELEALKYTLSQSRVVTTEEQSRHPSMQRDAGLPVIGIRITGGVGDYIVIARYLRDLQSATEPFKFDIYCNYQKPAHWVFSGVPGYRTCHNEFLFDEFVEHYSLALRISQYVVVHRETADWFQLKDFPRLVDIVQKIVQFRPSIETFIEHHPFMDGFLAQKAVYMNCTRANFLHRISNLQYGGDHFSISVDTAALKKFDLEPNSYMTVHNGFDPGVIIKTRSATKCYPYYGEVLELVKKAVPDLKVVQIGSSNSLAISGVDLDLIDKTTLPEAAALISNSCLHLDNESGLVHLASALGVRSCVMFGPTSVDYFAYESNINFVPKFCGGCWWITDTWMDECPRGFGEARCMTMHDPRAVAAAVVTALEDAGWSATKHPPNIRVLASQNRENAD